MLNAVFLQENDGVISFCLAKAVLEGPDSKQVFWFQKMCSFL